VVHQVTHEERQTILRQPVPQAQRQQQILGLDESVGPLSPLAHDQLARVGRDLHVVGLLAAQFERQPRPRELPVAHDALRGDLQHRGGFLDRQPAEEPQLDDPVEASGRT
jgi:hypothetical protein